jgi:hypothetical protein
MRSVTIFDAYTLYEDGTVIGRTGKELKHSLNYKGYPVVGLTDNNGRAKSRPVHRLLAENFIPNPDNLSDVNHIDCDRANFNLSNLEWMSHGENIKYSYTMNKRSALGTNNARCITDEETVHQICKLLATGMSPAQVRDAGFNYIRARSIKSKRNWKHISDQYF